MHSCTHYQISGKVTRVRKPFISRQHCSFNSMLHYLSKGCAVKKKKESQTVTFNGIVHNYLILHAVVPINDTFKTLLIANPDNIFRVISLYSTSKPNCANKTCPYLVNNPICLSVNLLCSIG